MRCIAFKIQTTTDQRAALLLFFIYKNAGLKTRTFIAGCAGLHNTLPAHCRLYVYRHYISVKHTSLLLAGNIAYTITKTRQDIVSTITTHCAGCTGLHNTLPAHCRLHTHRRYISTKYAGYLPAGCTI